jgi:hypothetical protein
MFNAQIRFFFKENPDDLSDDDFAIRVNELNWLAKEGMLKGIHL